MGWLLVIGLIGFCFNLGAFFGAQDDGPGVCRFRGPLDFIGVVIAILIPFVMCALMFAQIWRRRYIAKEM